MAQKPAKSTKSKPAPKPAKSAKPAPVAKVALKKPAAKPAPAKPVAKVAKAAAPTPAASSNSKKPLRKGITIVTPKPVKKVKAKPNIPSSISNLAGSLFGAGKSRKPLIPSGPTLKGSGVPLGYQGGVQVTEMPEIKAKTPFDKKQLEHYKAILIRKRLELVGDVSNMEQEALRGNSGSLSNLPQHIAEQGSDTFDQSLALDLAAADRKLIKEIEDALKRIEDGTFGICELTGKPIKAERLEELPWARYSIDAARMLERQQMTRP
ncbi:MAG: TraR/DksA family transcriptional regulator [Planctomycetes bacterium]|nr:TraR/DksA family transcriptional regulator [Planctomycetota bacterium]